MRAGTGGDGEGALAAETRRRSGRRLLKTRRDRGCASRGGWLGRGVDGARVARSCGLRADRRVGAHGRANVLIQIPGCGWRQPRGRIFFRGADLDLSCEERDLGGRDLVPSRARRDSRARREAVGR